jgi:hypothetical protein
MVIAQFVESLVGVLVRSPVSWIAGKALEGLLWPIHSVLAEVT